MGCRGLGFRSLSRGLGVEFKGSGFREGSQRVSGRAYSLGFRVEGIKLRIRTARLVYNMGIAENRDPHYTPQQATTHIVGTPETLNPEAPTLNPKEGPRASENPL